MNKSGFLHLLSVALLVMSGVAGCIAPSPGESVAAANAVRSNKPRLPPTAGATEAVAELVAGNMAFALDLYRVLFNAEENFFASPHSLSTALAMTYAGARGATAQQMAATLHYTLPPAQLHAAFNALDQALVSQREKGREAAYRLYVANALWGQAGHPFLAEFLDTLAEHYGAGLHTVDFAQVEAARQLINQWVSEQTEEKIPDLLPPDSLNRDSRLVLTNAVYFKAAWLHPFAEASTQDGSFTLLDGNQVMTPMMTQLAAFGYAEQPGVQAIELPYAGNELSMVILLPASGAFEPFIQGLDSAKLKTILGALQPIQVQLTMPRFRFEAGFQLKDALTALGMTEAFSAAADFSGMDGTRDLGIDDVYHKAFVAVDEAGTEAAAATAVVVGVTAMPVTELDVKIDRPFLFLIRDRATGTLLFFGHVVNPVI